MSLRKLCGSRVCWGMKLFDSLPRFCFWVSEVFWCIITMDQGRCLDIQRVREICMIDSNQYFTYFKLPRLACLYFFLVGTGLPCELTTSIQLAGLFSHVRSNSW
jgi:hypothetical protein